MLRKKADPALRLDSVVSMKMTLAERADWEEKARKAGMTASSLLRRVVLEGAVTVQALPTTDRDVVRFLQIYLRLLNKVEVILNFAVASMAAGDMTTRDYQTLVFSLDRVAHLFREELRHVD